MVVLKQDSTSLWEQDASLDGAAHMPASALVSCDKTRRRCSDMPIPRLMRLIHH